MISPTLMFSGSMVKIESTQRTRVFTVVPHSRMTVHRLSATNPTYETNFELSLRSVHAPGYPFSNSCMNLTVKSQFPTHLPLYLGASTAPILSASRLFRYAVTLMWTATTTGGVASRTRTKSHVGTNALKYECRTRRAATTARDGGTRFLSKPRAR